jgi:phasin
VAIRVQLLIVNWQLPPARLAKRFPKAYIFNTGAPDLGADGKDYRANSVHAPFPENQPKRPPTGERGSAAASLRSIARDPRGPTVNATSNPQTAAEQGRKNYRDVTIPDTSVPEAVRVMAEKAVDQSREVYDRSKDALDASVATVERTFDAAGQGAVAFNRKIIDIAQRNVNSGFDLAKSLAGAKNLSEMVELQAAYWQKLMGALTSQAEEVRALSTKMAAAATEPLKEQVKRGVDELRKAN